MAGRREPRASIEALIAFAAARPHDDDAVFRRLGDIVRGDPGAALDAGLELLQSPEADRRELGAELVGVAAEVDPALVDRALPPLRRVLVEEAEPGPISSAIIRLGQLSDAGARDRIIAFARHPERDVRFAVAFALPGVSLVDDDGDLAILTDDALAALRELSTDPDDDVRNWATFGIGGMHEGDDPAIREALLARVEDPHDETRGEAISGLAFRHDERVLPHHLREIAWLDADPDAAWPLIDEAAERMGIREP